MYAPTKKLFLKFAIVSGLSVLIQIAEAQQAIWKIAPHAYAPTALEVCTKFANEQWPGSIQNVSHTMLGEFAANCNIAFTNGSGTTQQAQRVDCPVGTVPDYTTGQCKDGCPANGTTAGVRNYTVAWSRNPDGSDIAVPPLDLNPKACVDSCEVQASTITKTDWIAKNPASNGLYRISADVSISHTGKACTPTDPNYNSSNPGGSIPPCPGTYGEINGKPVCLGNSPSNDKKPKNYGNPRAGSSPTDSAQTREPSASNGGNAGPGGGPGVTGGGTSGTNTGGGPVGGGNGGGGTDPDAPPDDEPQKSQCELTPNAAFCKEKVPIDETGTPAASGALFDSAIQQLDQSKDSLLDLFTDAASSDGKNTQWSFTFSLPSSCQAIETPIGQTALTTGFKLDVCKYQPVIHDLMAMVWISGTIWLLIGMFGNTLRST